MYELIKSKKLVYSDVRLNYPTFLIVSEFVVVNVPFQSVDDPCYS